MVTIEHEFDATVITLMDEGEAPLREDVTVRAFEDRVTLEQWEDGRLHAVTLSPAMLRDLRAALDLPEGIYRVRVKSGRWAGSGSV